MARQNRLERINGVMYFKGVRLRPRYFPRGRRQPYNPDDWVPTPPPLPPIPPPPLTWQIATLPWTSYTGTYESYA